MLLITFWLNDKKKTVEVDEAGTALEILRSLGLTGAKEGCGEGDCGACTVAVGELRGRKLRYRAVTSCLYPAPRLHGKHVITVEGLAENGKLNVVQKSVADRRAMHCGFCTPGIVISLWCLLASKSRPTPEDAAEALEGNLCRCTGYAAINRAVDALVAAAGKKGFSVMPGYCALIEKEMLAPLADPEKTGDETEYLRPKTMTEALAMIEPSKPGEPLRPVAGGSDVMVAKRLGKMAPKRLLDLSGVDELRRVSEDKKKIAIGAGLTLTEIAENAAVRRLLPALRGTVKKMASAQIRNVATLAGNLVSASPIADSVTTLIALDATVVLASAKKERRVPVEKFITGYRRTDLRPGEIVISFEIPTDWDYADFQKTAKRNCVDIATVNSAGAFRLAGSRVKEARVAFGGVAPTTVLLKKTVRYLKGRRLKDIDPEKAAALAPSEVAPISDVRGSKAYRLALVREHMIRHLLRLAARVEA